MIDLDKLLAQKCEEKSSFEESELWNILSSIVNAL